MIKFYYGPEKIAFSETTLPKFSQTSLLTAIIEELLPYPRKLILCKIFNEEAPDVMIHVEVSRQVNYKFSNVQFFGIEISTKQKSIF